MAGWRWWWATAPTPTSDGCRTRTTARDISAALRRLGFEVTTELDTDRVELTAALRAFTRRSAGADVSLVFYAGHGIEMDGVNYLVPVDARLERERGRGGSFADLNEDLLGGETLAAGVNSMTEPRPVINAFGTSPRPCGWTGHPDAPKGLRHRANSTSGETGKRRRSSGGAQWGIPPRTIPVGQALGCRSG